MMRYAITLFIFLLYTTLNFNATAQTIQQQLDSSIAALHGAKEDTNKVLLLCGISVNYFQTDPEKGKEYGEQALKLATELDYTYGIVKSNNVIARCYAIQNKYPEALKYFHAALVTAEKLNRPLVTATLLISLGAIYTDNKEYDKALGYLMRAKDAYDQAAMKNTASLMNNIGYLYSKQAKYEDALKYYLQGIEQEETNSTSQTELASLYANAGGMYTMLHDYARGLSYLFKALEIQKTLGNDKSEAFSLIGIGEAYYYAATDNRAMLADSIKNKKANLQKSIHYLEQAQVICRRLGIKDQLRTVYLTLSRIYELNENYKEAYRYHNMYAILNDSLRDVSKEKEFAKAEAEYFFQKKTDSLKFQNSLKDGELKRRKIERNSAILLITLVGAISLLLMNRQKLRLKQKSKLAETEAKYTKELAQRQLEAFTNSMQEKNNLIEEFSNEIEKYMASPAGNAIPDVNENLLKLQRSTILTDDQWRDFKAIFEEVHSGYIQRVKEKLPNLTPAELRIMVLARLKMDNKEMANILGIDTGTVRYHKHNLRKKIDNKDGDNLDDVVNSI